MCHKALKFCYSNYIIRHFLYLLIILFLCLFFFILILPPKYGHKLYCRIRCSSSHLLFMNVTLFLYNIHANFFLFLLLLITCFCTRKNLCLVYVFSATMGQQISNGDSNGVVKSISGLSEQERSNLPSFSHCHIMGAHMYVHTHAYVLREKKVVTGASETY